MRRFLALTLLLVFSLPLIQSAFAATSSPESKLPACCRRNGAHHCAMSADQRAVLSGGKQFSRAYTQCPAFPKAVASACTQTLSTPAAAPLLIAFFSGPEHVRKAEASARVALAGARHKRGPPAVRLS